MPPSSIKVGDLVEIQLAFSMVMNKKGKHTLLTKLRAVCVLSRAIEEVSSQYYMSTKPCRWPKYMYGKDMNYLTLQSFVSVRGGSVKSLKRKVGYNTDGEPVEAQMKKLKLTDLPATL